MALEDLDAVALNFKAEVARLRGTDRLTRAVGLLRPFGA